MLPALWVSKTGLSAQDRRMSTIANNLERNLRISLPEVVHGAGSEFFSVTSPPQYGDHVLFIYINFAVRKRDIRGYIAMLLDLPSLATLKVLLDSYIARTSGSPLTLP